MAFPKTILGIAIGWEKLGIKESWHKEGDPYNVATFSAHNFCRKRLEIGKEKGKLFLYCPRCMIKIVD